MDGLTKNCTHLVPGTQPCADPPVAICCRCQKALCQGHIYHEIEQPFCWGCQHEVEQEEPEAWNLLQGITDCFRL
ncbi:MAG TPA: hypothetical protein VGO93_02470 [Candidatus Xenobia bacterium]|jgi:hypothetical protein